MLIKLQLTLYNTNLFQDLLYYIYLHEENVNKSNKLSPVLNALINESHIVSLI